MARNMYGATSADFTVTSGGRVVAGAELTLWTARTGGTQITDLLDADLVACTTTTVTSDADGSIVYYGPDGDKDVHWADSGQGARVAIRPVDITGETGATPELTIGTVTTGTAAATIEGTAKEPVLNLTLPSAGANGVNTAAIQNGAVTPAKLATSGRFVFPTGAANGFGFTSGASHLSGTGSPEGVVTAAPGSTWLQTDATTDVKGWIRWVKATGTGNTGWQVGAEYDSGWRDVSASLVNGWTGTMYARRTADFVHFQFEGVVVGAATNDICYVPPAGFGRYTGIAENRAAAVADGAIAVFTDVRLNSSGVALRRTAGKTWYGSVVMATQRSAAPSSLPGDAA